MKALYAGKVGYSKHLLDYYYKAAEKADGVTLLVTRH